MLGVLYSPQRTVRKIPANLPCVCLSASDEAYLTQGCPVKTLPVTQDARKTVAPLPLLNTKPQLPSASHTQTPLEEQGKGVPGAAKQVSEKGLGPSCLHWLPEFAGPLGVQHLASELSRRLVSAAGAPHLSQREAAAVQVSNQILYNAQLLHTRIPECFSRIIFNPHNDS